MSIKNCPNCQKKLEGFLSSRYILSDKTNTFINTFHFPNSNSYCNANECGPGLIESYKKDIFEKCDELNKKILENLNLVPVLTINSPLNWEYEVIDIVSSQSVSGTGFFTEISGSWADFTGGQSNTMINKLATGEEICKQKLRYKCLMLGGNAIIGTDIDYSEVGGIKGMLMVCMAGTAIDAKATNAFANKWDGISTLKLWVNELTKLQSIKFPEFNDLNKELD